MLKKRIIPCLDIKDGLVVKGTNFKGLREIEKPDVLGEKYGKEGADELVFYDITASTEGRKIFSEVLKSVASKVFIPLTVGGGINTIEDFSRVLGCGADKVSVNSGAIKRPELILEGARKYGDQCVVFSIDIKKVGDEYRVFTKGGREDTGLEAMSWIKKGLSLGAGELVINSIDTDGVCKGFDIELLERVLEISNVPVIASGGAGSEEDFLELFKKLPEIDAGLAASIFHYDRVSIKDIKKLLFAEGISVRL